MEIAVSTSSAHIIFTRKKNVWFSISNGKWSDPTIWISNALGKRNITMPQVGDIVHVDHNVTLDINNVAIGELHGNGNLTFTINGLIFSVNSTLNMSGGIFMTSTNGTLNLRGVVNSLGALNPGTGNNLINYDSSISGQVIMPLTYNNLIIGGSGYNVSGGNIIVNGNLTVNNQERVLQCTYDLFSFSISIGGTTTVNGPGTLQKSTNLGTTLFTGLVNFISGTSFANFSGNPNMEFRGGLSIATLNSGAHNWGNGWMLFTTNNQNLKSINTFQTINIQIGSGVTLSNVSSSVFYSAGIIDGVDGTSTFNNDGQIHLLASTLPMATNGIFNYKHSTGTTLGLIFPGNFTLPYTSFENLTISGNTGTTSGIKSLSADTIISGNLLIGTSLSSPNNAGILECSSYALTINGTTTILEGSAQTAISKNSATGLLLFIGLASCTNSGAHQHFLFSGNPNVEFRGGWSSAGVEATLGTGVVTFSTNNQTITMNPAVIFTINILISGAIIVTFGGIVTLQYTCTGTINGDNILSTLKNSVTVFYKNNQQPMQTGILDCSSTPGNTFAYNLSGAQDITPGTYKNLTLAGSGAKKLLGNVSVTNTYTPTSPATLNSNGFALTNP